MIVRGLHIIGRQIVYLTVIFAILFTLLITGVYWLSNAVEQRQHEIASWLSGQIGYPVEIGAAKLDWVGVKPKLQISDVILLDRSHQQQLITLGNLYIGLDLIDSVQRGQAVVNDIAVNDLGLTIIRDYSGLFYIEDVSLPTGTTDSDFDWRAFALLLDSFQFENIKITYNDQINAAWSGQYELVIGTITKHDNTWLATGNIRLPATLGETILFTAQAERDDVDQLGRWQAQTKVTNLQLGTLAKDFVWQGVSLPTGNFSGHISATGRGTKAENINTDLTLSHLKLVNKAKEDPAVTVDTMQATLDWSQNGHSWLLSGKTVLAMNGEDWPETGFSVEMKDSGELSVRSDYLRLSDLTALAMLANTSPEILVQLQPAGDLNELTAYYSQQDGLTKLSFQLTEGVVLPWQNYPGVTNLTGQFAWHKGVAYIQIDSHDTTLYTKPWLEDSLYFDAITGNVTVDYSKNKWQLTSKQLHAWNDDLSIQVDGEIIKKESGKIETDLLLALDNIAVAQWKKYVPRQGFHPNFKSWSDKAFVAGTINSGEITLKGELAAFPYDKEPDKGQFAMQLHVSDVQLHYGPGWPDLTHLTGTITGTGNDLVIKTQTGKTAGFDFVDVTTVITHLTEKHPILRLEGEVKGTTANALQFLKDSPLKKRFGDVADAVIAKGNSTISLELMVPLADVDRTTVSGYVSFNNSQLKYKAFPEIGMTQIKGKLYFSEKGVHANSILATALNEPVTIDVKPDGDKAIILVSSYISTKQLATIWPDILPDSISGKTAYTLKLTVVEKELGHFYLDVELNSDLKGLKIDLPEPFGKESAQVRPLNFTMANSNNSLVYTAKYADIFNSIMRSKGDMWLGEISFGKRKAVLVQKGIKISGQLDAISIDEWLDWAKQQQGSSSQTAFLDSINDISLHLTNLQGFGQHIRSLKVVSQKEATGWHMYLDSKQIKGSVFLPNDFSSSERLKVNLDYLFINSPAYSENNAKKQNESSILWPSIDLTIGSFNLDNNALGKLTLTATQSSNIWRINSAQLSSDIYTLSVLKGEWNKQDESDNTTLSLFLESNDLDKLLANFGYQQPINAEKVSVKATVSWPTTPINFDLASFMGSMNMTIGKGTLQDVEPGAAGRIFGLMSIAALPRRLALDFRDLFGKGFTFDSITGDFTFKNGLATTDNFMLKSASAIIIITGVTDLVKKHYNQQVVVTPNVSSTLPLAGAVAGGPVGLGVGTAILLVDKLTDKLFNKNIINVISYKYDLKGPWDDPSVTVAAPANDTATTSSSKQVLGK